MNRLSVRRAAWRAAGMAPAGRHLGRPIPGNPTVTVQVMLGTGGIRVAKIQAGIQPATRGNVQKLMTRLHQTSRPARADRFLMSASLAPGRVTKDDIMEFDLDARPIINTAGFLAPDVPVFEMRKVAGSRSLLVTDAAVGKALAETLGNRPVALMRGHGNVVVGSNVQRVVARAIYTEVNARLLLQAITLGGPIVYIDAEEAKAGEVNRDRNEAGHGTDRIWQMWVEEAMDAGNPKR